MYACLLCILLFLHVIYIIGCPTNSLIDAAAFSRQLYDMRRKFQETHSFVEFLPQSHSEFLGGHTDVDLWFPFYKYGSPFGQFKVSTACDLECYDFDSFLTKPCRWRNEKNTCDIDGDEIDFIRMKGSWGESEGDTIFGKSDRADGYFLIAGIQQKVPPVYSAMLVSDPIQCQEGDGILRIKFWASPAVKVRVCTRAPSMGKRYIWCSEPLKRNGTKIAKVVIPGTIWYTFEIVVEAYNFTLDAFGKQGGAAVIDDISYNSTAIYECRMIPHYEPPPKVPKKTCTAIRCDFESGACLRDLDSTGFKITEEPVGPRSSGIRSQLDAFKNGNVMLDGAFRQNLSFMCELGTAGNQPCTAGSFAYAVGPGTSTLSLGPFELNRMFGIDFCYYAASYRSKLAVYITRSEQDEREQIYISDEVRGDRHHWICDKVYLYNGTYNSIEFSAEGLRNEYSYVGLDQIDVFDPIKGMSACVKKEKESTENLIPLRV